MARSPRWPCDASRLAVPSQIAGSQRGWRPTPQVVGRPAPFTALEQVFAILRWRLRLPLRARCVAAAIATAASPFSARIPRSAWVIALLVGIARSYVGAPLPLDAVGGWALGWLFGSIVHLTFGAPSGGPDLTHVTLAVETVVGPVQSVHPLVTDARGSIPYTATTPSGAAVFAKVVTRQHRDADVIFKLARLACSATARTSTVRVATTPSRARGLRDPMAGEQARAWHSAGIRRVAGSGARTIRRKSKGLDR